MRTILAALLAVAMSAPSMAAAQSFDDMLEAALPHWRAATWYARTGNVGVAALEAESFRDRWAALQERHKTPPPELARDGAWGATLWTVAEFAAAAVKALEADDAEAGGRALNGIAGELAAWRARNGRVGFSDRVAAYREAIDKLAVLAPGESAERIAVAPLREPMQRLGAAVDRLAQDPPARWRDDAAFAAALRQNREGVAALAAALDKPGVSALEIVGLIRVVRSNYWLLFLHYGGVVSGPALA